MEQLTFGVIEDACLADTRNRILVAWRAASYNHGCHKQNSLDKHLGVRHLSDCEDIDALEDYLAYVRGKNEH